jgi:hypothetical protein
MKVHFPGEEPESKVGESGPAQEDFKGTGREVVDVTGHVAEGIPMGSEPAGLETRDIRQ